MADYGIFIGFHRPARGRERQAIKVFGESMQYYARLQSEGQIESFEPVFLQPHGGDLGGFILLRGDRDKLAHLQVSDEFQNLTTRAQTVVDGVGVVNALLGGAVQQQVSDYEQRVGDLLG